MVMHSSILPTVSIPDGSTAEENGDGIDEVGFKLEENINDDNSGILICVTESPVDSKKRDSTQVSLHLMEGWEEVKWD